MAKVNAPTTPSVLGVAITRTSRRPEASELYLGGLPGDRGSIEVQIERVDGQRGPGAHAPAGDPLDGCGGRCSRIVRQRAPGSAGKLMGRAVGRGVQEKALEGEAACPPADDPVPSPTPRTPVESVEHAVPTTATRNAPCHCPIASPAFRAATVVYDGTPGKRAAETDQWNLRRR